MKTTDVFSENIVLQPVNSPRELDHEVQMAKSDLYRAGKSAMSLHNMLKNVSEQQGLEGWVQAKITKAADYLESVYHYLDYEMKSHHQEVEMEAAPVAPGAVPAGGTSTPGTSTTANPANAALEKQKAAAAVALQKKQIQDQIKATQKQLQDLQRQMQTIGTLAPMAETASAGASAAGSEASVANGMGKKKKDVGTLFGGTYKQNESEKLDEMPPVRSMGRAARSWADKKKSDDRRAHGFAKSYKDTDVGPSKAAQQADLDAAKDEFMKQGGKITKIPSKKMRMREDLEKRIAEIKKGEKDANGYTKCWPGKHAEGTKKGKNGGRVRNCVPNEGVEESGKTGPKFTGYWKGKDKNPPGKKMVGSD